MGEEEEVVHIMEDGQTNPTVCRSMNLQLTVGTLMKNADKIIQSMQLQKKKASYSSSKFLEKMKKLLSLSWVDFFNQIY